MIDDMTGVPPVWRYAGTTTLTYSIVTCSVINTLSELAILPPFMKRRPITSQKPNNAKFDQLCRKIHQQLLYYIDII
jgi:hypothetical protein